MKREQFLRKLKQYCKSTGQNYDWKPSEGKGSHGTVYVGGKKSIVQNADLPRDYITTILKQLGLGKDAV